MEMNKIKALLKLKVKEFTDDGGDSYKLTCPACGEFGILGSEDNFECKTKDCRVEEFLIWVSVDDKK